MKTILRQRLAATGGEQVEQEEASASSPELASLPSPQQQICRVCGRSAPNGKTLPSPTNGQSSSKSKTSQTSGNDSSFLCDACKKFYCRYRTKIQDEVCSCNGNSSSPSEKCRYCRYQRCEAAISEKRALSAPKPVQVERPEVEHLMERVDFAKLPCSVCGYSSSGFHFGVVSCEGCKGFFRRSMNRTYKIQYTCKEIRNESDKSDNKTLCPSSSNCRKCRLQRCLDAGMSLKEIEIGRHTVRRRAEIDAAIRKHFAAGSFLQSKVCRRKRPYAENEEGQSKEVPEPKLSPETLQSSQQTTPQIANKTDDSEDNDTGEDDESLSVVSQVFTNRAECVTPSVIARDEMGTEKGQNTYSGADLSKTPSTIVSPPTTALVSNPTTPVLVAYQFSASANAALDRSIEQSSDWLIDRAVDAAARLTTISTEKVVFTHEMTLEQMIAERIRGLDTYVKCVSEYVTVLPGITPILLADRIQLFTQAFFPISIAQLSLNFDVDQQIPNHLSLDREGPAWEMCAQALAPYHFMVERYLCEAGNKLVTAIGNLKEFALFCALLLLNPDTPNLQNPDVVRALRRRYELALLYHFSKDAGVRSEQRLGEIYQLFPFFRRATSMYHDVLTDISIKRPKDHLSWSPLFKQFHAQIVNLPTSPATPSTSGTPVDPLQPHT